MSNVKIVVQAPDTLTIGTIDDIPITPGTKSIGFDNEQRGGGPTPVLNVGAGKRFSFRTQIVSEDGLTMAKAFQLFQTLDNVALSAGTTGGDTDADVVGPLEITPTGDGTAEVEITVTGNPAA